VSCEQAREQFSALVDETLTREERADVYAHLATCADCRRELAALERTVALVRGATPVRAPDGFVDRVVTAARPTPWSVKIARGAFSPWPVKIPLGAAALLLVAGLAVLLFRGLETPQRVAQPETPTMASDRAAPAAPAPPAARQATPDEAMRVRPESPSVGIAPKLADAPGPSRNDTSLDERKALLAEKREPEADVRALLATPEPDAAERALAALVARLSGTVTTRRMIGDTRVIELAIPRDRYEDFVREAARLGQTWTASEPGTLPASVRILVYVGP
jgi:hypothetical protein